MAIINLPETDEAQDRQWERAQRMRDELSISDVLSTIDDLIAAEPDEQRHPLYGLVAWLLDRSNTPGASLEARCRHLAQTAIERLMEEEMARGDD